MGAFWRHVTGDSQIRWIGPDKGATHLATAAIVNAVWDLWAKAESKPVWRLVADLEPKEIVRLIDFRYLTDALTPEEALDLLRAQAPGKASRIAEMEAAGYPAYTTSAGWLGYPDDKLRRLSREGAAAGWTHLKIKVGRDLEDDVRRCRIIREEIGYDRKLMTDANQVWEVGQAIEWM
jgi:L-fuconate dehydratase